MKKLSVFLAAIIGFLLCCTPDIALAQSDTVNSVLGVSDKDLRAGNITIDTIPIMIASIIRFIIGVAGTIAIFMLIYFAVKMQLNSGVMWDSSGVEGAKKWMIASVVGFVIAISAWFIMARIIDILSITT